MHDYILSHEPYYVVAMLSYLLSTNTPYFDFYRVVHDNFFYLCNWPKPFPKYMSMNIPQPHLSVDVSTLIC